LDLLNVTQTCYDANIKTEAMPWVVLCCLSIGQRAEKMIPCLVGRCERWRDLCVSFPLRRSLWACVKQIKNGALVLALKATGFDCVNQMSGEHCKPQKLAV